MSDKWNIDDNDHGHTIDASRVIAREDNSDTTDVPQNITRTTKGTKELLDVCTQPATTAAGDPIPVPVQTVYLNYRFTEVTVDDTGWTQVSRTALADALFTTIRNETGFDTVARHNNPGAGITSGMPINDTEERSYTIDMGTNDDVYVRAEAGSGPIILFVEELS